jgi:AmmeMemoRadiSam system protein B
LDVDDELAAALAGVRSITIDAVVHGNEHSIEVELPLIRAIVGPVKVLPIMVQPSDRAEEVGRAVARAAADLGRRVQFLASTDLTHYGPAFGFEPAGRGPAGIRWAKNVNDRRFVYCVGQMDAAAVVPEAATHFNACGAGAVAATIAAVRETGAVRYVELLHTSSAEVRDEEGWAIENSVGYESGVFCA